MKKWRIGHVDPWWDDEFKSLEYQYFPIKNTWDETRWRSQGYTNITLNGALYASPRSMPAYADPFLSMFDWKDQGIGFFRMKTLEMFPLHQDHYTTYQQKFNLSDSKNIWRCVVFMEDWKSGHYFEIGGDPMVKWSRGDWVAWNDDVPHFAGNFGTEDRYTVQITGHL